MDESKALIAIPARMILLEYMKLVYLKLNPFEIKKISMVARRAKINDTGVSKKYVHVNGSINTIIAPRPAPAEIPSKPGSARLFFNSDCKIIPEQESAAPMLIAFRTLGKRISRITFL